MSTYPNLTFSVGTKTTFKVGDKVRYRDVYNNSYMKYNGLDTGEIKHVINSESALVVYPANTPRGFYKEYGAIINLNRLELAKKFENGWYRLKNFRDYVYYVKDSGDGILVYTHVYTPSTKVLEELQSGGVKVGTVLNGDLIKMEFVSSITL